MFPAFSEKGPEYFVWLTIHTYFLSLGFSKLFLSFVFFFFFFVLGGEGISWLGKKENGKALRVGGWMGGGHFSDSLTRFGLLQ